MPNTAAMGVVSRDVGRLAAPADPPFLDPERTLWETPHGSWREQLAMDPLAKWLSTSQSEHVDHMLRNVAVMQRLAWNDDSAPARDHVRWFIEQALRFLIDVGLDDPAVRDMYTRFRVRPGESEHAVKEPLRELAAALTLPDRRWTVRFTFSERLRAADAANCPVVCWQLASHDRGPEIVHVLGQSLMGLQDPP